jgi:cell division transport system permease protein
LHTDVSRPDFDEPRGSSLDVLRPIRTGGMRWLTYSIREAWLALRRGGRLSLISLGTIVTAFLILGAFFLVEQHVRTAAAAWADSAELSVFLDEELQEATRLALQEEIARHDGVVHVEFVSRPEALARFNREFPELSDVSTSLEENPFPASLEIRLRADPQAADAGDRLAETLRHRAGVSDVRYDRQWLADITALGQGLRLAGVVAVLILIVSAALTVSAVIRLGLHARKDELEIMELVGAPYTFIRGPFVMEGAILGGAGAALALGVLWVGLVAARRAGIEALTALYGTGQLLFLDFGRGAVLLGGAVLVGALAGLVASHQSSRKGPFPGPSR